MKVDNFISENTKKVGLLVSGGMDSALMLYLITKEIKDNALPVEFASYTVNGANKNTEDHAKRIVATVEKMHDINIKNTNVGVDYAHSDFKIVYGVIDALNMEQKTNVPLDILYLATTGIPDDLKDVFGSPRRNATPSLGVIQPWGASVTKDQVVKYIVEHNLNDLIENSHSCTSLPYHHCGECWNCIERKWALDKNGAEDLSKIREGWLRG